MVHHELRDWFKTGLVFQALRRSTTITPSSCMKKHDPLIASELFSAHTVAPLDGTPAWANLVFKLKAHSRTRIGGCGLYCVAHKDRAIYIGKFLGTDSNPFGGDLQKIRWERHLPSLTMRGHGVTVGKRVLDKLRQENHASALIRDLLEANPSELTRYKGYHASYNRMRFAAMHWDVFQADPAAVLPAFKFGYVQFEPGDLEGRREKDIWGLVSRAETAAREQLHLCCNGESDFDASLAGPQMDLTQALESIYTTMEGLRGTGAGRSAAPRAAPRAKAPEPAVSRTPSRPKHLEYDAAMERLEETLPAGWRTEWLERLRLAFEGEAVEVHATNTHSHGDVRVRALDLKRKRNVFTMAWRPSDGKFTCRILMNTEQVAACPGVERLSTSQSDPLKTGFIFDASQDQERALAGLLGLIEQALQRARDSGR